MAVQKAQVPAFLVSPCKETVLTRTWNMIYQRALTLGVHRRVNTLNTIPQNVTIEDLNVIPDRDMAMKLVSEAAKRGNRSYGVCCTRQD